LVVQVGRIDTLQADPEMSFRVDGRLSLAMRRASNRRTAEEMGHSAGSCVVLPKSHAVGRDRDEDFRGVGIRMARRPELRDIYRSLNFKKALGLHNCLPETQNA